MVPCRAHLGRGRVDVLESDHHQGTGRRALDEVQRGFQDRDAGALRPHQGVREVETLLGQEAVEVVAGDPPRELVEPAPDEVGVAVPEVPQHPVDLAPPSAFRDDPLQLVFAGRPDPHPKPVVGEHLHLGHVVGHAGAGSVELRHDRVVAARVVPDHSADRAVVVRGRGGTERHPRLGRLPEVAEVVEDRAGLDPGQLAVAVDVQDPVQILGEVDDHRGVATLPGQAGAPSPRQDGRVVITADLDRGEDVVERLGDHHTDGELSIVRRVRRVDRPCSGVEPDLTLDRLAEPGLKAPDIHVRRTLHRGGHVRTSAARSCPETAWRRWWPAAAYP